MKIFNSFQIIIASLQEVKGGITYWSEVAYYHQRKTWRPYQVAGWEIHSFRNRKGQKGSWNQENGGSLRNYQEEVRRSKGLNLPKGYIGEWHGRSLENKDWWPLLGACCQIQAHWNRKSRFGGWVVEDYRYSRVDQIEAEVNLGISQSEGGTSKTLMGFILNHLNFDFWVWNFKIECIVKI